MFFKIFRRQNIFLWIGILFFSFSLTLLEGQPFHNQAADKPLVIGYSNHPSWWTWMVIEDQDLFTQNNLNAKLKWYDNYSDSVRDFKLGLLDANSELVVGKNKVENLEESSGVAVLLNNYSNGEDQLIVKPGIKELQALKEKTIIAESNEILDLFLNDGSVKQKVDIRNLETGLASAAFVTDNNIDGVISYPPYSEISLKSEGARVIASSADFPQEIARMLVVQSDLANQSSETVNKLRAAWFDGLTFLQENPVEAQEIIASKLNLDVFQVAKAQTQIRLVGKQENSLILAKNNQLKAR